MLPTVADQILFRAPKGDAAPTAKGPHTSGRDDTPSQNKGDMRPDFDSIFAEESKGTASKTDKAQTFLTVAPSDAATNPTDADDSQSDIMADPAAPDWDDDTIDMAQPEADPLPDDASDVYFDGRDALDQSATDDQALDATPAEVDPRIETPQQTQTAISSDHPDSLPKPPAIGLSPVQHSPDMPDVSFVSTVQSSAEMPTDMPASKANFGSETALANTASAHDVARAKNAGPSPSSAPQVEIGQIARSDSAGAVKPERGQSPAAVPTAQMPPLPRATTPEANQLPVRADVAMGRADQRTNPVDTSSRPAPGPSPSVPLWANAIPGWADGGRARPAASIAPAAQAVSASPPAQLPSTQTGTGQAELPNVIQATGLGVPTQDNDVGRPVAVGVSPQAAPVFSGGQMPAPGRETQMAAQGREAQMPAQGREAQMPVHDMAATPPRPLVEPSGQLQAAPRTQDALPNPTTPAHPPEIGGQRDPRQGQPSEFRPQVAAAPRAMSQDASRPSADQPTPILPDRAAAPTPAAPTPAAPTPAAPAASPIAPLATGMWAGRTPIDNMSEIAQTMARPAQPGMAQPGADQSMPPLPEVVRPGPQAAASPAALAAFNTSPSTLSTPVVTTGTRAQPDTPVTPAPTLDNSAATTPPRSGPIAASAPVSNAPLIASAPVPNPPLATAVPPAQTENPRRFDARPADSRQASAIERSAPVAQGPTHALSQPVGNTGRLAHSVQMARATAITPRAPMSERLISRAQSEQDPASHSALSAMTHLSETPALPRALAQAGLNMPDLPRHVAQQVMAGIKATPEKTADIFLSPAELGRVRISLQSGDAGIVVSIMADRPETLDLLRRNVELLAQDFHDIGYGSAEFSFGQEQGAGTQTSDHRAGTPSAGTARDLNEPADIVQNVPAPAPNTIKLDRVDLRL